uniref:Uncharacterized protein n=1 Tax=Amphimedon queenslandica TaxID=400682 RepID=A0A1X7TJM5_AMPQE
MVAGLHHSTQSRNYHDTSSSNLDQDEKKQ